MSEMYVATLFMSCTLLCAVKLYKLISTPVMSIVAMFRDLKLRRVDEPFSFPRDFFAAHSVLESASLNTCRSAAWHYCKGNTDTSNESESVLVFASVLLLFRVCRKLDIADESVPGDGSDWSRAMRMLTVSSVMALFKFENDESCALPVAQFARGVLNAQENKAITHEALTKEMQRYEFLVISNAPVFSMCTDNTLVHCNRLFNTGTDMSSEKEMAFFIGFTAIVDVNRLSSAFGEEKVGTALCAASLACCNRASLRDRFDSHERGVAARILAAVLREEDAQMFVGGLFAVVGTWHNSVTSRRHVSESMQLLRQSQGDF